MDKLKESVLNLYNSVTGRNETYKDVRKRFAEMKVYEPLFWGDWRDDPERGHLLEDDLDEEGFCFLG